MVVKLHRAVLALLLLVAVCLLFLLEAAVAPLSLFAQEEESEKLSIIMYHQILDNESRQNDYVITPAQLEKDLQYLEKNGYHTVLMKEVIAYVQNGTPLPEKPVLLSFDDGFESFYTLVLPLLEKYDMKAIVAVVGSYCETYSAINDHNIAYSQLTWDELTELEQTGRVEVQSHSYNLHSLSPRKGASQKKGEDTAAYQAFLREDCLKLQNALKENCGISPTTYVYPYGAISKTSLPVISELFLASLSCQEGVNLLTVGQPEGLYRLKRYNRPAFVETENFFAKIEKKAAG